MEREVAVENQSMSTDNLTFAQEPGRATDMARDLPSFWLGELAAGRGTGPVNATVARNELDRRGRDAQESMISLLDALSTRFENGPGRRF